MDDTPIPSPAMSSELTSSSSANFSNSFPPKFCNLSDYLGYAAIAEFKNLKRKKQHILTMAAICEERINSLIDSVTFAIDTPSKLESLHQLKQELLRVAAAEDTTVYFSEFIPSLLILFSDCFSPVRKCVTEVIGEIGLRHLEVLPETTPALLTVIDDDTSAVARQAITSGTNIFCRTLERIAIEGLHASKLDSSLESAWEWMVKLKEKIYSIAFEPGSDGRRLLALKFVAAIILIYTPDPNGSTELPTHLIGDGKDVGFNISWLRRASCPHCEIS
ncbi:hypothetical protein BVRB_5g102710 isoform C [Beta vulgaris subsp. vulgaris]|nr:hypothetical protein BVRB_5g102710 isoform C [Beta vulgaris subsp. vulgaris]